MTTATTTRPPAPAGGFGRLAALPAGRRTKWVVLGLWVVAALLALGPSAGLTDAQKNDAASWLPHGAESTQVVDALRGVPGSQDVPLVLVYERPSGVTAADASAVRSQVARFTTVTGVGEDVVGPVTSPDGKAVQVVLTVVAGSGGDGFAQVADVVSGVRSAATGTPPGLAFHVTGPGGMAADSGAAFEGIDGKLLYSALAVVVLILLLTYRSPVLWLLPVVSAVVALTCAQAVVSLLATHDRLTVNAQSAGILTVLVFGAGTDYALLLVARYREELRRHEDRHEAMALALHRSGPAILASGATVVAGLLCLLAGTLSSTTGLGPVAAIGIAVGLAVMLTLLPALLVICGRWVFWPARPTYGAADPTGAGVWGRVGRRIARAPRRTWVVTSLVLVAASVGVLQLDATGLADRDSFTTRPDSVVGQDVVARHFPAVAGSPVLVVADTARATEVAAAVRGVPGVASTTAATPLGGGRSLVQATLRDAPDSTAAGTTLAAVRDAVHAVPGAHAITGGDTAIRQDTLAASDRENRVIIPLILAVVFVVLALLLRSLVAPVLLIATVVASYGAALGLSALLFRHVLGFAGADPSIPLFTFVFLVALGIDYNIFLMTRVREEAHTLGTRKAALVGLSSTGGVITSAGLVLAGTFAVLASLPLVSFAEIGITVALGVLLDTIVVRSVLVTALTLDVGRRMWWPGSLWRGEREVEATADPVSRERAEALSV